MTWRLNSTVLLVVAGPLEGLTRVLMMVTAVVPALAGVIVALAVLL
jgi:hypothetical protein